MSTSRLYTSTGHLTKETITDIAKGKFKKGTPEEESIHRHFIACRTHSCKDRLLNLTGGEPVKSYKKAHPGFVSRVGSLIHNLFGGSDKPFHG